MRDLVSVVMPAYNHGRHIVEAIESVLHQDHAAVELIVIDDGSTDETRAILERYGDHFRWESQPNAGQSAALTRGWKLAKGSILGYLSADDVLHPGAVSAAVRALAADPSLVLTYSDYELISPESSVIRTVRAPETDWCEMVGRLVCAPGPGAFFTRKAYEAAGPWRKDLRMVPDFDFFLRLRNEGEFCHIPEVLAQFRVHPGSQSFAVRGEEESEEMLRVVTEYFGREGLPPAVIARKRQAMGRAALFSARLHIRAFRVRSAARLLRAAWREDWRGVLSIDGLRLVLNALFNRLGHALYWRLQGLFGIGRRRR